MTIPAEKPSVQELPDTINHNGKDIKIAYPEVTLIASTQLATDTVDTPSISKIMDLDTHATDSESLIEFAGRACYQSFHKPNPLTQANADYLQRTVFGQGHGSIAEHATASVYITGVSRAFLAEITRHRHLNFSVLSQRFVDESDSAIVIPPAYMDPALDMCQEDLKNTMSTILSAYDDLVARGKEAGLTRKQSREAARSILPNMTEVKMVISGNYRSWTEVINRRTAPDADAEIQLVMGKVRDVLAETSPVFFQNQPVAE